MPSIHFTDEDIGASESLSNLPGGGAVTDIFKIKKRMGRGGWRSMDFLVRQEEGYQTLRAASSG